jgi:hypothetical protein
VNGATTSDPSTGIDQIFAIATTSSGAIFTAGYDLAAGLQDSGVLKNVTALMVHSKLHLIQTVLFKLIQTQETWTRLLRSTVDDSYLYATGFQDDDDRYLAYT